MMGLQVLRKTEGGKLNGRKIIASDFANVKEIVIRIGTRRT
jgi:hypothetical protein